ncbi:MAG: tetratricopeptide repeat protein, partial [Planctomycetota bacterium]
RRNRHRRRSPSPNGERGKDDEMQTMRSWLILASLWLALTPLAARAVDDAEVCALAHDLLDTGDVDGAIAMLRGHTDQVCAQVLLLRSYRVSYRLDVGVHAARQWLESAAKPNAPALVEAAALLYAEAGQVGEALELLARALQEAPKQPRLLTMRSRLLFAIGECDEAASLAAAAIEHGGQTTARCYLLAATNARSAAASETTTALVESALLTALTMDDAHVLSRFELGRLRQRQGRPAEAAVEFRRVLQADRENLGALLNLAAALRRLDAAAEAAQVLARFQHQSQLAEREKDLTQQLRNNIGNLEALRDLGAFYVARGKFTTAAPLLRQVLAATTTDGSAWLAWAQVERSRGDFGRAFASLQQALTHDSTLQVARIEMAEVTVAAGRRDIAMQVLDRCRPAPRATGVEASESTAAADFRERWLLCRAEAVGTDWKLREPVLQQALVLGSLAASRQYAVGAALWPEPQQVWAVLDELRQQHQEVPAVLLAGALFALEVGDKKRADRWLEAALARAPWRAEVHEALARSHELAGRKDAAQQASKRAAELRVLH